MIQKIKEQLNSVVGKNLHFRFNGARNQIEEFDGYIENTYNFIFTIKPVNENHLKSFTYSDVLIENLEIFDNN